MVSVNTDVNGNPLQCNLQIDGYLLSVLNDSEELIKKNFDCIGLVTGEEGAGKTTLAMQCCYYLDQNFNNNHICFNARGFEELLKTLPKGSAILWDEADDVGSNWASAMMITLKKTFKRIRKMNYKIFLVTPTFHDLNKYFAIHRTRFLINVYAEFTERGMFRFYDSFAKKKLYINGKKEMNMRAYKSTFYGAFKNYPKSFPVDFEKYEKDKDEATLEALGDKGTGKDMRMDYYKNLRLLLESKGYKLGNKDYAEVFGLTRQTIGNYRRELGFEK